MTQRGLLDVQAPTLFVDGLQHEMDMRVRFVGMQDESVPVFTPKFLSCEVSHGSQHLSRGRPRRHREHEFMDQLGWLSAVRCGEVGLATYIVEVEIPVVQKVLSYWTIQAITVVGLQFKLSVTPDVVEVLAHCLKIVAGTRQYLHDGLRRLPDSPPDLLHLRRR